MFPKQITNPLALLLWLELHPCRRDRHLLIPSRHGKRIQVPNRIHKIKIYAYTHIHHRASKVFRNARGHTLSITRDLSSTHTGASRDASRIHQRTSPRSPHLPNRRPRLRKTNSPIQSPERPSRQSDNQAHWPIESHLITPRWILSTPTSQIRTQQ
jgi:hypothetical protein